MYRINVQGNLRCNVLDINPCGKKTIVFVHGWPLNHKIFESQYTVLPEYGIRCIGLDLRGYGMSDRPWEGYDYDRLADDLCAVIKSIDAPCVTLCGFSMGGAVCARYMSRHRGYKVNKLILMGSATPCFTQRAGYPLGMTREQVDGLIKDIYADQPKACGEFSKNCFMTKPSAAYLNNFDSYSNDVSNYAAIKSLESLRDEDLRQDLSNINVPTLIMHSVQDKICPFGFAQEMKNCIANSYIVPFENSGHCLFFEEKDKCNATIIDFVNSSF